MVSGGGRLREGPRDLVRAVGEAGSVAGASHPLGGAGLEIFSEHLPQSAEGSKEQGRSDYFLQRNFLQR